MSAIAQRRVAGATALMILLYLLQVALFAPNAQADHGDVFEFVFDNEKVFNYPDGNHEESAPGGDWNLASSRFSDGPAFDDPGLTTIGLKMHVSCSEAFPGGYTSKTDADQFPRSSGHSAWKIASYEIHNELGGSNFKICGETFTPGSITVVKTTDPEIADDFDFKLIGTETPCPDGGGTGCGGSVNDTQSVDGMDSGSDENVYTWSGLNGGDYSLEELTANNPPGYTLDSVSCEDESGVVNVVLSGDSASFSLSGDQHITCTFHNTSSAPGEATVSVSGTCAVVQGVAQFTYTVTASDGVTVDFDGGNQNVTNGGTYVSSSSSASWVATAPEGDLFSNETDTTSGTATVTDCTPPPPPPPQPQTVTASVSALCVVNDADTGVGQFTVTISPAGAATVTINGQAVASGGSIELPDDSTYPVTVVAAAGWTLSGDIPTEASVGDCPDEIEVLGTTITTVPEVSADTLPFTGFESGDTVKLGLLALLAGALMLFAARGRKEEEEIATDMGGWSDF